MQLGERGDCVTDLVFDQWFAGECGDARVARIEQHLRSCARCRLRGELIERDRAAFLAKAPTLADNARHARGSRSPAPERMRRGLWLSVAAATAAAAIAVLALMPAAGSHEQAPAAAGERRKGGFHVGFYVKRGGEVQRGASGDTVYPGDLLRFTYSSDVPTYLALLGRDERDASVYFPASGDASRVTAGSDQPLDFSLELDAQLGSERLYAVACPAAFALAPLRETLLRAGELPVPPGCRVERIALRKEAPP